MKKYVDELSYVWIWMYCTPLMKGHVKPTNVLIAEINGGEGCAKHGRPLALL
jgi:hypothetical protein